MKARTGWGMLVVIGAVVLSACGGSNDAATPATGTTASPATTTAALPANAGADLAPTQLKDALLAPADLGAGWTVGKTATPKATVAGTGPTTTVLGAEICDGVHMPTALNAITGPDVAQVTLSLLSGTAVSESIGVLPTDAAQAMAQTKQVFEQCNGKVRTNPLSKSAGASTFETLTLTLGDDSSASRATINNGSLELTTTLVIGRRGSVVASLVVTNTSKAHEAATFSDADLAKLVDAANAKFAKIQ